MQPGVYDYLAQDRVIWGKPAATAVVEEAERLKASRVFIVASRSLNRKTDVVEKIRAALGSRCVGTFDECREHTPRDTVIAAAAAARIAKPDLIVSVGGGTVIDTVKVMLICLAHDLTHVDQLDGYHLSVGPDGQRIVPVIKSPPCRQIAVPTTLSGAEFSNFGGCTNTAKGVKDGYTAREIGPQSVILDAEATLPTPEWLWLSTGIRAVDHAVESICSIAPVPLIDGTALHALRLMQENLAASRDPANLDARLKCLQAVWLAAIGILRVPYGASHGIGHSLGAVTGMAHGHTSCIMLPVVLKWNQSHNPVQQKLIAEAFGRTDGNASQAVWDLVDAVGQPHRLRDVKVKKEDFEKIAAGGLNNIWVRTNPRPVTKTGDIIEMLGMAW